MRKMKKALAVMLAATMTMSMGMTAFADGTGTKEIDFNKTYSIVNEGTTKPQETFTFIITPYDVEKSHYEKDEEGNLPSDFPTPKFVSENGVLSTTGTMTFEPNDTNKNIKLQLPDYKYVGIYYYSISETKGTTPGVTYSVDDDVILKVSVYYNDNDQLEVSYVLYDVDEEGDLTTKRNGSKDGSIDFTNKYEAAIDLKILKDVEGALGDKGAYFEFKVKLVDSNENHNYGDTSFNIVASDKNMPEKYADRQSSQVSVNGDEATVFLKHGETITIENLPYDVKYEVREVGDNDYNTSIKTMYDDDTVTIDSANSLKVSGTVNSAHEGVIYTNTYKEEFTPDTGIFLDSAPYILLLTLAALGMFGFVSQKRSMEF